MEQVMWDVRPNKREFQPNLGLAKGLADALRDHAKSRWPTGTAKCAARAWDLSEDEGRGLAKGRASKTTIEKVMKRGDALLALLLVAEVRGQKPSDLINEVRGLQNSHAEQIRELFGDVLSSGAGRSFAAPGGAAELYRRGGRRAG